MIERVTRENVMTLATRYVATRGGMQNEDTDSEACFIASGDFRGVYVLFDAPKIGPIWIGTQNATARFTNDGKPFPNVAAAIHKILDARGALNRNFHVYYSDNAVERLRWIADEVQRHYDLNRTIIVMEAKL